MNIAMIPALNEEKTIAKVILRCEDFVDEVIVCDDGSTDQTALIAEGLGVEVIRHEDNRGKGEALRSLFQRATKLQPEVALTIDADGQHDPESIPRLIEAVKNGADIAIGGRTGIPFLRKVGNAMLSGFRDLDTQSGFRAYKGSILPQLMPSEMGMGVDSEIIEKAWALGFTIRQVKIESRYDVPNPSKKNLVYHFLDVAFTRFKLASFRHPLILYGLPGVGFGISSLFFGFRALATSSQGVGLFSLAVAQGLISLYLMQIGLATMSMAITIWTVVTMERRLERRK